ncbi:RDD family protein [Actinoplanes solisilvae]|uniref:RDD family protein n=1 Tax=Actinoplanes solisilvae TaxID=2486853 RepID=UPI0013E3EA84|nr:RDD family protein [Actinoplanes solisilvae]
MSYANTQSATTTGTDVRVTGRRVVATLIDGVVLGGIGGVISSLFGETTTGSGFAYTRLSPGGSLLLLVITIGYYVLLEGLLGRTLGKMVTGIRVVDANTGNRPGMGAVVIRTLLRIIDGLVGYLVGFIVVLSTERRQRIGDLAAKTLVVRN